MSSNPYGLSENPFAAGHDTRFIFQSEQRVEVVALLRKRIAEGASFVTVTGDSGCGKTSVVTEVLESGDLEAKAAFIAHPSLTPSELLEAVCIEFGAPLPKTPSKPQTLASLEKHLRELKRQGRLGLLVLDEAHGLKTELLEEARLLSNMKSDGRGLLQTILVGLPELERRLGLPELAQLRQRIAVHGRIAPLSPEETEAYVQFRVTAAGGDGPALFPAETCAEIYDYTNGFPRDINTLAGNALEHAERDQAPVVLVEHVRMAAGDARPGIATVQRPQDGHQPSEPKRKPAIARAAAERPRTPERPVEEPPPRPEVRKPPSFLSAQHYARSGGPPAARTNDRAAATAPPAGKPTQEPRFQTGEVTADELAADRPGAPGPRGASDPTSQMLASEHVQELGASVLLVGLLVIMLIVTGRWDPVAPPPAKPDAEHVRSAMASDPTTAPAPGAGPVLPEGLPRIDPVAGATGRLGYGFEVYSTSSPDSAIAVMQRIARGTKQPCRIVTKTAGDPYRVVVGPFPTRRDAQKGINDLLKTPLVKRAALVQIPE